jgi:acetyl esterase/lipase
MALRFICLSALLVLPAAMQARLRAAPASGAVSIDQGMKVTLNIPYTRDDDPARSLDLYLPEARHGRLPLVIMIHGGGWNAGDKKDFGGVCRDFVRRGYAAASINYRFIKQAIFPAQAIDCKAAVRWLRAHARRYGLDMGRFAVGGHSAGGHLAAFLGATNGLKQFDQGDNLKVSSDVQAVLWCAGVSDILAWVATPGFEGWGGPNGGASMLIGGPVAENHDKAIAASPVTYVSRHSAPFDIYHGDSDHLVPTAQAKIMYAALREHGVTCELHILPNAGHGGPGYFTLSMMNEVDEFFRRVMKIPPGRGMGFKPGNREYRISPFSAPALVLDSATTGVDAKGFVGIAEPMGTRGQAWVFVPLPGGRFSIHPADRPALALTVDGAGTANNTRLLLQPDTHSDAQSWLVERDEVGGTFALSPACAPNSTLDDHSGAATPEAVIDIFGYNGGDPHLRWLIAPVVEHR